MHGHASCNTYDNIVCKHRGQLKHTHEKARHKLILGKAHHTRIHLRRMPPAPPPWRSLGSLGHEVVANVFVDFSAQLRQGVWLRDIVLHRRRLPQISYTTCSVPGHTTSQTSARGRFKELISMKVTGGIPDPLMDNRASIFMLSHFLLLPPKWMRYQCCGCRPQTVEANIRIVRGVTLVWWNIVFIKHS